MDYLTAIVVLVPTVLNLCVSGIYAYIALRKAKEPPKDEIWETATKMVCSSGSPSDADDFAQIYEELKWFKQNGCSLGQKHSLLSAVNEEKQLRKQ